MIDGAFRDADPGIVQRKYPIDRSYDDEQISPDDREGCRPHQEAGEYHDRRTEHPGQHHHPQREGMRVRETSWSDHLRYGVSRCGRDEREICHGSQAAGQGAERARSSGDQSEDSDDLDAIRDFRYQDFDLKTHQGEGFSFTRGSYDDGCLHQGRIDEEDQCHRARD